MNKTELFEAVVECLSGMDVADLIDLWNRYSADIRADDAIYYRDSIDDVLSEYNPSEIIGMIEELPSGWDDIFWFDGYGYVHFGYSADLLDGDSDCPFEVDELADYMIRREDSMGVREIDDLLCEEVSEDA